MKRLASPLTVVLLLASAGVASADHYRKYFPLREGNSWTFETSTMKAEVAYSGMHYVTGIPTLGNAWLAWSGTTLYAWDAGDSRWEPLFRFGAPTGTTYDVRLSGTALWSWVRVTVAAKGETVRLSRAERTLTGCIRFTFEFMGVADAGLTDASFAPHRGLARFTETSFAGPVRSELTSAFIDGRPWGLNPIANVEQGSFSNYPTSGTNKVRLINTQSAWASFYEQHQPGATPPAVDFSKHTVCVARAGQRSSGGYAVRIDKATWNHPYASVTVHVDETVPSGPAIMVITQPYHIVLLEKKVHTAYVSWEIVE